MSAGGNMYRLLPCLCCVKAQSTRRQHTLAICKHPVKTHENKHLTNDTVSRDTSLHSRRRKHECWGNLMTEPTSVHSHFIQVPKKLGELQTVRIHLPRYITDNFNTTRRILSSREQKPSKPAAHKPPQTTGSFTRLAENTILWTRSQIQGPSIVS